MLEAETIGHDFKEAVKQLFIAYESQKDLKAIRLELEEFDNKFDILKEIVLKIKIVVEDDLREEIKEAGNITSLARNIMLGGYGMSLLVALAASFFLTHSIVDPMKKLKEVIDKFGSGVLDAKAETKSKDETGELAAAFNKMADDINRLNSKSTAANQQLIKQQEESKDNIDTLQKFNKIAIDREIRMRKLKNEVKSLKEEITELKQEKNK